MKLILTILALCTVACITAQESTKAISYNIRWNNVGDNEDQWNNRKTAVSKFLMEEAADFMGFQEALVEQVGFLDENLEVYDYLGVGRDDGKEKGEFCPLFFNKIKWQSVEQATIWLSETPEKVSLGWDGACNRVVTYGVFVRRNSTDTIAVFNTHFDHRGAEARKNSVTLLKQFVSDKSNGKPYIILGDFNFTPDTPLYEDITEFFLDAREKAGKRSEEHPGTFNGFRLDGDYNRRIDYLFYSPMLDAISYACPDLRLKGRHVSDHFPVIGTFRYAR